MLYDLIKLFSWSDGFPSHHPHFYFWQATALAPAPPPFLPWPLKLIAPLWNFKRINVCVGNKPTNMAIWQGGGLRSKLRSNTVFPLHLKSVWWHSLRSWSFSPQMMLTTRFGSWSLFLKALLFKRRNFDQFVSLRQTFV
jgi:hypothetical protein